MCVGVGVNQCPVDFEDVHGEEEKVVAEDVGFPRSIRKVVGIQIPESAEEVCVVAVDQGIARPVGLPLDQVHLCVNDVVVKPLRGDEGLNVV